MDENLFCQHEAYLEELSEIYAKRIELTRKIKHWDEIWREYTQFEVVYQRVEIMLYANLVLISLI